MKVLVCASDFDMCYLVRVAQPFIELKKFGVEMDLMCYLPSNPEIHPDKVLIDTIRQYDLVIVQRCYIYGFVSRIFNVCQLLGIPSIFETDDNYFALIRSNPAYYAVMEDQSLFRQFINFQNQGNFEEANKLVPLMEESRIAGLSGYLEILKMADYVTVSTEELARSIRTYNKNVVVLENQISSVMPHRDNYPVEDCLEEFAPGKFKVNLPSALGLYSVPSYKTIQSEKTGKGLSYIPRIGYSCTPSHRYEDFSTISGALNEYLNENKSKQFLCLFGDNGHPNCKQIHQDAGIPCDCYWFTRQFEDRSVTFPIPPSQYERYFFNLRNVDIGLCPLFPTEFNMSKSDLKMLEYGAWGTPALAPRYITYSRHWKDEENCLMYYNDAEFKEQLGRLCKSKSLRDKLGKNAYDYVKENRLEKLHAEKRYNFYKFTIENSKRLEEFR